MVPKSMPKNEWVMPAMLRGSYVFNFKTLKGSQASQLSAGLVQVLYNFQQSFLPAAVVEIRDTLWFYLMGGSDC
jgi:hypothetical protein